MRVTGNGAILLFGFELWTWVLISYSKTLKEPLYNGGYQVMEQWLSLSGFQPLTMYIYVRIYSHHRIIILWSYGSFPSVLYI